MPDGREEYELRFAVDDPGSGRVAGLLRSRFARYRPDGVDCDGWVYTEYLRAPDADGTGDRSIRIRQYAPERLTGFSAPGLAVFEDKRGGGGTGRVKRRWTFDTRALETAAEVISPALLAEYLVAEPRFPYPRLGEAAVRAAASELPPVLRRMFSVSYRRTHHLLPSAGVRVTCDEDLLLRGPDPARRACGEMAGVRVEVKGGRRDVEHAALLLGLEPAQAGALSKRALGLRLFPA